MVNFQERRFPNSGSGTAGGQDLKWWICISERKERKKERTESIINIDRLKGEGVRTQTAAKVSNMSTNLVPNLDICRHAKPYVTPTLDHGNMLDTAKRTGKTALGIPNIT